MLFVFTLFPFSSCLSFWARFWTILGSILEWFWTPFSHFFRFQDRSKNQRFFASLFLWIWLDFGAQDGGHSLFFFCFCCLIFVLGAFWVDFCTILIDSGTLFQQILGSMFDFSAPFRSLLGSLPSSFHAFVLPFLPPAMHLFVPPSFHRCFPLSLVPFRIWVLAFLWHVRRSPFPQRPSTVLHFFVHLFLHRLAPTILARRTARSD